MFPNCNQNCPRSSDFAIPSGTRYRTPRVSAREWHSLPAVDAYCDACAARPRNDHSVCNVVEAGLAYDTFSWFRQHNSILWIATRNTRRMGLIKLIRLIPSPGITQTQIGNAGTNQENNYTGIVLLTMIYNPSGASHSSTKSTNVQTLNTRWVFTLRDLFIAVLKCFKTRVYFLRKRL